MSFILDNNKLKLGTCYYPEQWPKEMWEDDLERMLKAGLEVIRIAEFAWSKVEPKESQFEYDFFDEFLDLCDKVGMKVIFCTPTATPPAWLTEKYPESLNADIYGNKYRHGSRRHYNYNSPIYREKCETIVEELASHYGKRKCIIGWQIDNEVNCEINEFYSDSDTGAFRRWLLNKYREVENVNKAWGTEFWNQTYTDWNEIYVPRPTVNGAHNPHQMLDYYRFISDSAKEFVRLQAAIIKIHKKPDDFITTNGLFGHLDNHAMTKESLDFMMYDSYPNFNNRVGTEVSEKDLRDRWWSKNLSEVRSVSPIFGIMEQQTGANGWTIRDGVPNPRPGQITLWTMQSIAHGADFVSFFRWRTATAGTEMYWHGILDYSGRENERLEEVTRISDILKELKTVAGKEYLADVAVLKDYDNIFDAEIDKWHGSISAVSEIALFEAMQKSHTPYDYVYFTEEGTTQELLKYKVVFYPHPVIADEERARLLEAYVREGGTLILGCRSGQKNKNGQCVMDRLPGVFKIMSGADVKEYSFIQPDYDKVRIDIGMESIKAELFTDRLVNNISSEAIGTYANEYFKGDIAVTRNKFGKGFVYYYGSAFNEDAVRYFLNITGTKEPFADVVSAPKSVELARRGDCLFILNYKQIAQDVIFNETVSDVRTNETLNGRVEIPGYGFLVIKRI